MTQKQLERKVRYWQKILKLDHWDITCCFVQPDENEGRIGTSSLQAPYLSVRLFILDTCFYKGRTQEDNPEESLNKIIIHELLHCHFGSLDNTKDTKANDNEERVITILERIIYDLWAGE